MLLGTFFALLTALPAIVVASPYGDGGRFGFKSCQDRGRRPGKVSCINFDTIKTDTTTFTAEVPSDYTGLTFSSQFSVLNVTAAVDILPLQNRHAAASLPNSLIGSRYNPKDKKDHAPASFSVKEGTFDLFGFYMQPMGSPPPGATIYVKGYPADEGREFMYTMSFSADSREPFFFDTHEHAGPEKWDGLRKVEIWAYYSTDEADWEFFVDDIWLRWGTGARAIEGHHDLQGLFTQ